MSSFLSNPKVVALIAWAKRNERHISTVVFIFGFLGDIATFTLIQIQYVTLVFVGYLVAAAIFTYLSHVVVSRKDEVVSEHRVKIRNLISLLAPLGVQFVGGSLLSGFLIFYTKSATFDVSWPFLVLLAIIFLGNEVFRDYRAHLVFQTVLVFFSLYAYLIFALPLSVGSLGPKVFIESTVLAAVIFAAFLGLLAWSGWKRLKETFGLIVLGCGTILLAIVISYFTGLIPPIPLTLTDSGIYHNLVREDGGYTVSAEHQLAWWHFATPTIHHVDGDPIYAYSSIFAPGDFTASIIHEWQYYDTTKKQWVTQSEIAFSLTGGRKDGYRGYSGVSNVQPGEWRVNIETINGQVIGRVRFNVVSATTEPQLDLEAK